MYTILPVSPFMEEGERIAGNGGVLLRVVVTADVRGYLEEKKKKKTGVRADLQVTRGMLGVIHFVHFTTTQVKLDY